MAVVHPNEDDVSSFRMSNRIDVVVVVMNDWCHFNKFDDAISHSKRPSNSFDFILITCFNITDPLIEESLEKIPWQMNFNAFVPWPFRRQYEPSFTFLEVSRCENFRPEYRNYWGPNWNWIFRVVVKCAVVVSQTRWFDQKWTRDPCEVWGLGVKEAKPTQKELTNKIYGWLTKTINLRRRSFEVGQKWTSYAFIKPHNHGLFHVQYEKCLPFFPGNSHSNTVDRCDALCP